MVDLVEVARLRESVELELECNLIASGKRKSN